MQAGEGDTNIQVSSRHARVGMVPVMRSVSGLPWRAVPLGFEQVWEEGDDKRFENQLMQLADAIIDNDLYKDFACSFY